MSTRQITLLIKKLKLKVNLTEIVENVITIKGKKITIAYEENLVEALPIIKKTLHKCAKLITPKLDIIFIVVNAPDEFIKNKMRGVGGTTMNDEYVHGKPITVIIKINTKSKKWKKFGLSSTIAHEFNHAVRSFYIDRSNIREDLAAEGLAQCFEIEISGVVPPWSIALKKRTISKMLPKLNRYLDVTSNSIYERIFFGYYKGKPDKVFPMWCGYAVSYFLIKKRLLELKVSWESATRLGSKELINL